VENEFPSEFISQPILEKIEGKSATTIVLSSKYTRSTNQSRLLVKIETGRKHQIRMHLASKGFPIIGDRLYYSSFHEKDKKGTLSKANKEFRQPDLQLKSCYLSFVCPMTQLKQEYKI
jgi:tRNA pseudouridine32 synthase/23S rRNA pseudouridine746 synthase